MSGQLTSPGKGPFGPETTRKEAPCGPSLGLDVCVLRGGGGGETTVSLRPPAVASVWQTQAGSPAALLAFRHTCPALGLGVFICEMGVALLLSPMRPPPWGALLPSCRMGVHCLLSLRATPGQEPGPVPRLRSTGSGPGRGLARQDWGVTRGICQ